MKIILASASPRREYLMREMGLSFSVVPADGEEEIHSSGSRRSPGELARECALAKACEVALKLSEEALVVGADTIVVLDGEVLGKPKDPAEAEAMLSRLSGRTHTVITGVAVVRAPGMDERVESAETEVTFRPLSPEEIRSYVRSGEPMDKAGAYGIQGRAGLMVASLCGCYYNVMGLPVATLAEMLKEFGVKAFNGK